MHGQQNVKTLLEILFTVMIAIHLALHCHLDKILMLYLTSKSPFALYAI